jgi:hypothetical protein
MAHLLMLDDPTCLILYPCEHELFTLEHLVLISLKAQWLSPALSLSLLLSFSPSLFLSFSLSLSLSNTHEVYRPLFGDVTRPFSLKNEFGEPLAYAS